MPMTPPNPPPGPFPPPVSPVAKLAATQREPMFRRPEPDAPRPPGPAGAPRGPAPANDRALETNAYAIAYRLLGDRGAAAAVSGIAAQRVRQNGLVERPDWLCHLALFTVEQAVQPLPGAGTRPEDTDAGLRAALRRRLARATPLERIAGSLVHLSGYPAGFVAQLLGRDEQEVLALSGILAPPPGVAYRNLGDPQLTRSEPASSDADRRRWRPRWTTVAVVVVLLALVVAATQMTGPRPTLGPPVEEGRAAVVLDHGTPDDGVPDEGLPDDGAVPGQRNGGPLTQQTSE